MNIGIIGGGYSGVISAIHIARSHPTYQVTLINDNAAGLGIAYSTPYDYHLLNVPAGKMSAFADKSDHFIDWLIAQQYSNPSEKDEPISKHFISRKIYGEYIQNILKQSLSSQTNLEVILDEALGLSKMKDQWQVDFNRTQPKLFNKIVLALGNSKPTGLFNFAKSPRIIENPWDWKKITAIPKQAHVLIVGSGLTMVDVALSLKNHQHQGPITTLSRHGYLPHAHDLTAPPPIEWEHVPKTILGIIKAIRINTIKPNTHWRSVIDGLRPHTQGLWLSLHEKERKRFLRHARASWDVHRHRIATRISEEIKELIDKKQLKVKAGRILNLNQDNDKLNLTFRQRYDAGEKSLNPDFIINCIGPNGDYSKLDIPLVKSLILLKELTPCPLKLGINTTTTGALINAQGDASKTLFSVGPPTKGIFWETIAVPDIRVQAQALANIL